MSRLSKEKIITVIIILIGWLLAVGFPTTTGHAYHGQEQDDSQHKQHTRHKKNKDGGIEPQAGNGCGTDFLFDAPWRIDPTASYIPLVFEIKDENYGCGGFGLDVGWNDPMYLEVRDYMAGPSVAESAR